MPSDPHAIPYGASWSEWSEWIEGMPSSVRLGLTCIEVEKGKVILRHDSTDWLNPTGAVHGGIVMACADQGFGAVAATVMDAGSVPATATFTSDFLRPAFPPLTFEAVVQRLGRTLVFVSVTTRDRAGKVCNEARGTLSVNGSSRLAASLAGETTDPLSA